MSIGDFVLLLLPYTIISLLLVFVSCFFVKSEPITAVKAGADRNDSNAGGMLKMSSRKYMIIYLALFIFSMLTVLHIVHYLVMLAVVSVVVLVVQPKLFKEADYMLLITFVAFFVFVGNIKQVDWVNSFLSSCVGGNEVVVSVVASQVISNVPAAVLLSGFTDNYAGLMIGTNIGGLGTIIASMASLISYKLYAKTKESNIGRYMLLFTAINVAFLAVLLLAAFII